ncbi:unnamed protein product [Pelagomonas calceolata]|uniref:Myb-like domain-containing protein n=1 Tax=Pelagomonas calceolata TaxID=35677 RepID=A0A7S3ZQ25_9STRA|nr:unnamed protein product [Pelagomonas calceolata]|mmetsp:Transcript_7817/g.21928  ORF Transcript_7817/g.21928 Transcript_7817/m.21928 type:complete len:885 (+) Transcript_7817:82-2736(+)
MDRRGGASPQTPVKRRSRLDEVTFGADGRARDTHAQHARKRRQIAVSDDDESEDDASSSFLSAAGAGSKPTRPRRAASKRAVVESSNDDDDDDDASSSDEESESSESESESEEDVEAAPKKMSEDDEPTVKKNKNTGRWTEDEHARFLRGLELFGKNLSKVADFVQSRTYSQVHTHNQKYLKKLAKGSSTRRKPRYWTADETQALKDGYKLHGEKWAKILRESSVLKKGGRTPEDVRAKWVNLEKKKKREATPVEKKKKSETRDWTPDMARRQAVQARVLRGGQLSREEVDSLGNIEAMTWACAMGSSAKADAIELCRGGKMTAVSLPAADALKDYCRSWFETNDGPFVPDEACLEELWRRWRYDSYLPSAVKREYVRMLRAAREDIKERGPRVPVEEAIKAAQARVTGYGRRDIELLSRIQSTVRLRACTSELALSMIVQPETTLGVAVACRDASPEAAAVMIVALAADEDINRFWPVLSQWEAWVKSEEMGSRWRPTVEMRHVGDASWRSFNSQTDAARAFGVDLSEVQILIRNRRASERSRRFEARKIANDRINRSDEGRDFALIVAPPPAPEQITKGKAPYRYRTMDCTKGDAAPAAAPLPAPPLPIEAAASAAAAPPAAAAASLLMTCVGADARSGFVSALGSCAAPEDASPAISESLPFGDRTGLPWSPAEEDALRALVEEKKKGETMTWEQIAGRLGTGRSEGAVIQHWSVMHSRTGPRTYPCKHKCGRVFSHAIAAFNHSKACKYRAVDWRAQFPIDGGLRPPHWSWPGADSCMTLAERATLAAAEAREEQRHNEPLVAILAPGLRLPWEAVRIIVSYWARGAAKANEAEEAAAEPVAEPVAESIAESIAELDPEAKKRARLLRARALILKGRFQA